MKKELNRVTLRFPSKSSNEGFIRASAAAFAAQLDPTLDELGDIKTAVSEGVTNAIVHAYPDTVGLITVTLSILEDSFFRVQIKDRGCGISDLEKAREPMFTTGGAERSGMGFTIMENFMDSFRVSSNVSKGTTVTMTKKIRSRLAARVLS